MLERAGLGELGDGVANLPPLAPPMRRKI